MAKELRSFEANDSETPNLNELILLPENRIQFSEEEQKRFPERFLDPPPLNEDMNEAMGSHARLIVSSES